MADTSFPMPGIVDIRMPIVGDSFSWNGVEPLAAKRSIVIHGTASDAQNEDGFTMADYHVNHNKWGGIGVHFVVTKDDYQGRPGQTPAGPQVQYVGDLSTWRAGTGGQNYGRIHIELSGLFTNKTPSESQLRLTRNLIDFMLAPNNILPQMNYYNQVTYHNAVPGQNTSCPGWQYPYFGEWFAYLQGGPEPSWFSTQQPLPAPAPVPVAEVPQIEVPADPTPSPVPESTPEPASVEEPTPVAEPEVSGSILDNEPDYKSSYTTLSEPIDCITTHDAYAVDATGAEAPIPVPAGRELTLVGHFLDNGKSYYRTDVGVIADGLHGTWYGLSEEAFEPKSGQPNGEIPITVVEPVPTDDNFLLKLAKAIAGVVGAILKALRIKK